MLLEHQIGNDAGRERERQQHEHDRAAGDEQRPARTDELDRESDARRHRHERGQPDGRVARAQIGRIIGAPKSSALGVEEQRGELEVEVGPQTEDEANRGGDGKRDHEAGSVHAVDPTRV